jgi:uncharacterized membrane protein
MSFRLTVVVIVALIGAVVGFATSKREDFGQKTFSAFGGAVVALMIGGLVVMLFEL